ncbi:MAG: NAD(+) synthase, partial [Coriobacteriales bacterium]|nr:NAD(+) synthase [Coriobacteriales bacterium]
MYVALVQNNPTTGALKDNADMVLKAVEALSKQPYPPDLVVFPAYALTGFPLHGLGRSAAFAAEVLDTAQRLIKEAKLPILLGMVLPQQIPDVPGFFCEPESLYCKDGDGGSLGFSYGTFGEDGGQETDASYASDIRGTDMVKVKMEGLTVCIILDAYPDETNDLRDCDLIIMQLAKDYNGADSLFTSSQQLGYLKEVAQMNSAWLMVSNLVGAQDDMVFDGGSLVINPEGELIASAPVFEESVILQNIPSLKSNGPGRASMAVVAEAAEEADATVEKADVVSAGVETAEAEAEAAGENGESVSLTAGVHNGLVTPLLPYEADWKALTVAVRDYLHKNGFTDVVIGISGGLDSAVTAVLAADVLGSEHLHGVIMPSAHTPESSTADAQELAEALGIKTVILPIDGPLKAFSELYQEQLGSLGSDLAQQNIQARIRMIHLMQLANTHGWLLLNTTNKSEAAVGYSTLYGDTAGSYAPLGNIYKTDVYGLAEWRNTKQKVIPAAILTKAPSAELFAGQLDQDTLPPYEVLDRILKLHIEENMGIDQIIDATSSGHLLDPIDPEIIADVLHRVRVSEFKRRQEPLSPTLGPVDM